MDGVNLRRQGNYYEQKTAEKMKQEGYEILDVNYYAKGAELDIIARKGEILVFVEVKARKKSTGLSPFGAVDRKKQKKIIMGARQYIFEKNLHKNYVRFDVAGVFPDAAGSEKIEIIKDAFQES